jgi:hypothetical protein
VWLYLSVVTWLFQSPRLLTFPGTKRVKTLNVYVTMEMFRN